MSGMEHNCSTMPNGNVIASLGNIISLSNLRWHYLKWANSLPIALLLKADVNQLEIEKEIDFIVLLHLTPIANIDVHYHTPNGKPNSLHVIL